MKRTPFIVSALSVATLGILLSTSCKKDAQDVNNRSLNAGALATGCLDATVDSTITGVVSTNLTLSNTKIYKLSGLVYVTAGNTLTIQHGTRILGLAGTPGTPGTPGGGLVITRGAKIMAIGQPDCPIVFTSYRYNDNTVPDSAKSGDWAGVIILGRARINNPISGDSARIEGIPNGFPASPYYGGTNDADNSGVLQYVRIEYAGFELAVDNEINGLTLGGVGSGTTIDYVAVTESRDDAIEWFGGSVNASHLISINALDDMFDTDNGYNGKIQYALGVADPLRADKSQSNGFESDNNAGGTNVVSPNRFTHPTYDFITIVGVANSAAALDSTKQPSSTGRYGRGAHFRRAAEFSLNHAIIMGYNYGISMDSALGSPSTIDKYYSGTSTITNSYVHGFGASLTPAVGPYATESNGLPNAGVRFSNGLKFQWQAVSQGNVQLKSTNPNGGAWLVAPFGASPNYAANPLSPAHVSGSMIDTWALGSTPNKWTQVRW